MRDPIIFSSDSGDYAVQVSYRKIRGRGLNAPERLYGSDGLFQISVVTNSGTVLRQKGLPFQSKTNWRGRSKVVAAQCLKMKLTTGEGLIIDYSQRGYRTCPTTVAIETEGSRVEANKLGAMKPLGQMLGVDFLECRIGKTGLYFDTDKERYFDGSNLVHPVHAITTRVVRRSRSS